MTELGDSDKIVEKSFKEEPRSDLGGLDNCYSVR